MTTTQLREFPAVGSTVNVSGNRLVVVEFTPQLGYNHLSRYGWVTLSDGTEGTIYKNKVLVTY